MTNKRKPSKSAPRKSPHSSVIMNPLVGGLPEDMTPAYDLTVTQKEQFFEIAREMHKNKVLSSIDRFEITNAAVIFDKLMHAKTRLDAGGLTQVYESGAEAPSAHLTAFNAIHKEWILCCNHLGLTPGSRMKITKKASGEKSTVEKESPKKSMVIGGRSK